MSCCLIKKQIQGGYKLRTYKLTKNDYKMETYLYHISDHEVRRDLTKLRCSNHEVRRDLTKLRCSNHSILIEQGRYSKLNVGERLCKKCNKVEDEIHFLIECKLYDSVRKKFFSDSNIISVETRSYTALTIKTRTSS